MKANILKNSLLLIATAVLCHSCTKVETDDDFPEGDPPPVPGGYVNSSEIAPGNLKAHWTFENTNNETKSNTAPIGQKNNTFVRGIKGQALHLEDGYLLFPNIASLSGVDALPSFTVSLWVYVNNNGSKASCFWALTQPTNVQGDWGGPINVGAETGRPTTTTNLTVHTWFGHYPSGTRIGGDNINDFGVLNVDYKTFAGTNRWVHYIARYDASVSAIDLYANSVRVSNNNFRIRTTGGNPFGPLKLPTQPTQVLIGAFPNQASGYTLSGVQGWQAQLTGSLDEIRVYNKALTDGEISALYKLERQGR